ncbi:hypothetical protein [Sphingomonas japonica]|uniref:hypothetical protein n=1 Tax=Sphingomonas japonica TaxID=511662 RepID=UPI001ABAC19C|nr:hypothetical protein [Sphingomonas japonica]
MALATLGFCAVSAAAQTVSGTPSAGSDRTTAEQIAPTAAPAAPKPPPGTVQQIRPNNRASTEILQLPPDAEVAPSAESPEQALAEGLPRSPRLNLYEEVAAVWEMIRKRGQQPTPDLIAREIGPENLARFLSDFPAAANMFGVDSDLIPVPPPPPSTPPSDK